MKRALFIIANNYRGRRSVRELNVGRDMVTLGGFFEHVAGYDIVEIVQDLPREQVLARLEALLRRLEPGDLLVIYFGGHGVQGAEHLLVLPPGAQDPAGAALGFLAVAELRRRSENRGLSLGMILDCCRNSDAGAEPVVTAAAEYTRRVKTDAAVRDINVGPPAVLRPGVARGSFAIFCACSDDDVAPELGDSGRGLFSTAVVHVLQRLHHAGQAAQLDDALRALVEAEMHRIAAEAGQSCRPQPWKAGNGTPRVLDARAAAAAVPASVLPPAASPQPSTPSEKVIANSMGGQQTSADSLASSTPSEKIITNSIGMRLVRIEPGTFLMGSPSDEAERMDNERQHAVTLTRPFYMAATTVSQKQWKAVMGKGVNPSRFQGDDLPVENVSWYDALEFCEKLSRMEGKPYRLPTEAQWEYCCRAGTTTAFHTGGTISTDQANYDGREADGRGRTGENRGKTVPVGQFEPNAWGLYQMHGNVGEWCEDICVDYPEDAITDPAGGDEEPNASRVLRGGSWDGAGALYCRAAWRNWLAPDERNDTLGFRVALDFH